MRCKIRRTSSVPWLSVNRSLKHISGQVIDDTAGRTIAAVTSTSASLKESHPHDVQMTVEAPNYSG